MSEKNGSLKSNVKIALYSKQDRPMRYIRMSEVARMINSGEAAWKRDGSGRIVGCRLVTLLRADKNSAAMITHAELRANAGEFGCSRTRNISEARKMEMQLRGEDAEDFIERATNKIAAFAMALPSDLKTVKVWPRGTVLLTAWAAGA